MNKESSRKISIYIPRNKPCKPKTQSMYGGHHITTSSTLVLFVKPKQHTFPHVILEYFLIYITIKLSEYQTVNIHWDLTFRRPCIVIYSYNESKWDALFLKFIWQSTLHVSDRSTVHHQEYLNTAYTQQVFVMLVLLASASSQSTELAWQISNACIQFWDAPDDGQWTCPKHVEYFVK
jgi:hypothetical protein